MLTVLAAVVALACVLASARRLALAMETTSLDPRLLLEALRGSDASRRRSLVAAGAALEPSWDADVLAAASLPDAAARDAALEEQLSERDWRAFRWGRVPRVCASIATSGGFLFACIAVLQSLATDPDEPLLAASDLFAALGSVVTGIAGATFCVAVHYRARRIVRTRIEASDRLVDLLRAHA